MPTARKPRKVLSLLLLNENRTVATSTLISELWGENPPKSGQTLVQTYILHLRQLFARAFGLSSAEVAKELLQTRNGGYAFVLGKGELDLHEYRRWQADGDQALVAGDDGAAVAAYRRALAEWQGSALLDVEHGHLIAAQVVGLEQSRLTVTERKIEAELRLGRHHDTLSELAALVLTHPFHEGLHAHFMLALYRSGNRNRALEIFGHLRTSLVSELGIEPAPKLQRLHRAILTAEPGLDPPGTGPEAVDRLRFTG
ncbi:BTAD domain-containing putative transcriptional regulator [Amycolatopsis sp. QT-25]|uniref:AfsR/SARP family transcriptional regulator n=1 Tax=Amycolatopsis sp. QT-25 TaxID=3034022 RepID=UPI0023EB144A|nr:BTAD domain-containing putative transcriptional regulator [Amycolatopsis sp. QT-25]WET76178.1 BTAD domain-containing putative transcriptional regulator [Amycolatopsis sp. QT-25]